MSTFRNIFTSTNNSSVIEAVHDVLFWKENTLDIQYQTLVADFKEKIVKDWQEIAMEINETPLNVSIDRLNEIENVYMKLAHLTQHEDFHEVIQWNMIFDNVKNTMERVFFKHVLTCCCWLLIWEVRAEAQKPTNINKSEIDIFQHKCQNLFEFLLRSLTGNNSVGTKTTIWKVGLFTLLSNLQDELRKTPALASASEFLKINDADQKYVSNFLEALIESRRKDGKIILGQYFAILFSGQMKVLYLIRLYRYFNSKYRNYQDLFEVYFKRFSSTSKVNLVVNVVAILHRGNEKDVIGDVLENFKRILPNELALEVLDAVLLYVEAKRTYEFFEYFRKLVSKLPIHQNRQLHDTILQKFSDNTSESSINRFLLTLNAREVNTIRSPKRTKNK